MSEYFFRCITRSTRPWDPSGGSGRIEDACGESPAASLFWLRSFVKFKLFVHYSFVIRSFFVLIRALCKGSHRKDMLRYLGATCGCSADIVPEFLGRSGASWRHFRRSWDGPGGSWGDLGSSWGGLGGLWEPHGVILRGLGAVLGGPGAIPRALDTLWGSSWRVLGRSWGGLGGSWAGLGAILGALGGVLGRSWAVLWRS